MFFFLFGPLVLWISTIDSTRTISQYNAALRNNHWTNQSYCNCQELTCWGAYFRSSVGCPAHTFALVSVFIALFYQTSRAYPDHVSAAYVVNVFWRSVWQTRRCPSPRSRLTPGSAQPQQRRRDGPDWQDTLFFFGGGGGTVHLVAKTYRTWTGFAI